MSSISGLDDSVASLLGELRQCDIRIHVDGDLLRIRGAKANLTPEFTQRIQRLKGELLSFLLAAEHQGATSTPIPRRAADAPLHLSFMQQNLWLIDQLEGSAHYNMASALSIEGSFDPLLLERALHATVERHESLRTVFRVAADGMPRQVVLPASGFRMDVVDLTALDSETQAVEVKRLSSLEAQRPFDLGNDLMMRSTLLRLTQDRFVLLNTKHHIASDGSSLDVLIEEMCVLYEAYRKGEASPLPALPIQYADYSVWLSQWLQGEMLEKKLGYWKQQLANLPLLHSLPLDHPRPRRRTTIGGRHTRTYAPRNGDALRALCNEHDVTLFMLVEAAFAVFLSRWSGERDIVIATPISSRSRPELTPMIGYFTNTLVLRSDCDEDMSFVDFLRASKKMILDAQEHRHAPFETLVDQLNPPRSLAYNALAQVSFLLPNSKAATIEAIELPGVRIIPLNDNDNEHVAMKFDLELLVREGNGGLCAMWGFNTDIFDRSTIERMDRHFECLLDGIAAAPGERLSRLPMLPGVDAARISAWSATGMALPPGAAASSVDGQVVVGSQPIQPEVADRARSYPDRNVLAERLAEQIIRAHGYADTVHPHILDRHGQPVPVGVVGELYIGGIRTAAVAPDDPPLIEDRFVTRVIDGQADAFRTGECARWLDDGTIEYLGPLDQLRGLRIDLSGIEGHLDAQTGAEQNQPPSTPTEEILVELWSQVLHRAPPGVGANFFEVGGRSLLASQLASLIRQQLSIEMPLRVVFEHPVLRDQAIWLSRQQQGCSSSPVQSGTVEPDLRSPTAESQPARVAMCSQTERTLTTIWAAYLDIAVENIGVTDSFFEIGGNSRLSIRLQADIREILGIEVAMADLFEYPTIQDLARFIDGATTRHADRSSVLKSAKDRVLRVRARSRNVR